MPRRLEGQPPRKPGRKPKVDAAAQKRVYDWLLAGASIADCAGLLGCSERTLRQARQNDADFRRGVKEAQKSAKLRLIKKVGNAKPWQAAAWMLERKYGSEYGRKDRMEHTGKGGGPIKQHTTVDLSGFSDDELLRFERAAAGRAIRTGAASDN